MRSLVQGPAGDACMSCRLPSANKKVTSGSAPMMSKGSTAQSTSNVRQTHAVQPEIPRPEPHV